MRWVKLLALAASDQEVVGLIPDPSNSFYRTCHSKFDRSQDWQ